MRTAPSSIALAPGAPARTRSQVVVLPASPASARLARRHVQAVTGRPEDSRLALVVSELVTNAVIHARSGPRVEVTVSGGCVRIEVGDDGPGRPVMRPLTAEPDLGGRGLALVASASRAWGVVEHPGGRGKTVWAEVELP